MNLDIFDKEVKTLFIQLKEVLNANEANKLRIDDKPNIFMVTLERYIKAYSLSEAKEHVEYFENIFNKNRIPILNGLSSDSWLLNGKIKIIFGEGTPSANPRVAIQLSAIYSIASKLRKEAEDRLEGMPNSDSENCIDLIRSDVILLHLYRIFRECCKEKQDRDKIVEVIKELEKDLGVGVTSTVNTAVPDTTQNNPFGNILGAATQAFSGMGLKLPDGQKLPDGAQMGKIINDLVTSNAAQSLLSNVFGGLQGATSFPDAFAKIATTFQDPKMIDNMSKAISQIAPGLNTGLVPGSSGNVPLGSLNLQSLGLSLPNINPPQSNVPTENIQPTSTIGPD
jgi:hypothetical protein